MILRVCLSVCLCAHALAATVHIKQGDEGLLVTYNGVVLQEQPAEPKSVHGVYLSAIHEGRVIANEQFNTAAHRHHGSFFLRAVECLPEGAKFILVIHRDGLRYWDDDASTAFHALTGRAYSGGPYYAHGTIGEVGVHQSEERVRPGLNAAGATADDVQTRSLQSETWSTDDSDSSAPYFERFVRTPPIDEGYSRRHVEIIGYNLARPILVHTYRPRNFTSESPILFMMHGQTRQGDVELALLHEMVERQGALVIAPEFEGEHHPTSHHYERGGTEILAEKYWSFMAIEHLFDYVKACTDNTSETYLIMGHSAGGYFTHRFAIYMSEARYRVAIALNSGSYALPKKGAPFATDERLRTSLQRRAIIMIGDYRLSSEPPTGKTGLRKRGEAAIAAHRERADKLGVPCNWELRFVDGVGHVPGPMFNAAESILFAN